MGLYKMHKITTRRTGNNIFFTTLKWIDNCDLLSVQLAEKQGKIVKSLSPYLNMEIVSHKKIAIEKELDLLRKLLILEALKKQTNVNFIAIFQERLVFFIKTYMLQK